MADPKNKKHKEYTRFAAHCLEMVTIVKDQEARSIQREMAAEWLKLADATLRSSKHRTSSK
jgi:hypothetical protein